MKKEFNLIKLLRLSCTLILCMGLTTAFAQPANDDCANAAALSCGQTVSGTTTGATFDNVGFCGTSNTSPGVWYALTNPGDGSVITLSTCDQAAYDTKISVFKDGCGTLTCVGGQDDATGCFGFTTEFTFASNAGDGDYLVLVHGFGTAAGNFELTATCVAPLVNDDCATAEAIGVGGGAGTVSGSTVTATNDPANVDFCGTSDMGAPDVWYTFTAVEDGEATLDLCNSNYDTKIQVFTGSCGSLVCVTGDDDAGPPDICPGFLQSVVQFPVTSGTVYTVQVYGFLSASGDFELNFDLPEVILPCGIDCPDPISVANPGNDCEVAVDVPDPTVTDGCVIQESTAEVVVSILTDGFSSETTWEITDGGGAVVASGDPNEDDTLIEETVQVACGGDYTFTIFDSFGDGICCGFGDGSYSVTVEGVEIVSGGEFGDSESTSFGTSCEASAPAFFSNSVTGVGSLNGGLFPIGDTEVTFTAFDAGGNPSSCTTTVTVAEPVFEPGSIGCFAPGVHVTLSEDNCTATISAGDLLQGSNYGCFTYYDVELYYDEAKTQPLGYNLTNDGVTSGELGEEIYAVVMSPAGDVCWTTIIPEDKTAPVLECPCEPIALTEIEGEVSAESPIYSPPQIVGTCEIAPVDRIFDVSDFEVDSDDTYTVEVLDFDNGFLDNISALQIYEGAFNPADPCDNLLDLSIDDGPSVQFDGVAGVTYIIVFNPFFVGDIGAYTLGISGAAGGNAIQPDPECVQECVDIDEYLAYDDINAYPGATFAARLEAYIQDKGFAEDACGPLTYAISQSLNDVECGDDILTRTITVTDESGNSTTCSYDITFTKPDVADVDPPSDRDQDPADNTPADDWLLCDAIFAKDANGAPHPSVTGYPTIDGENITPSENTVACELGASYEDVVVEICEGTTKYYRTWTILSWCPTGEGARTFVQNIKVVDKVGPTFIPIADVTISTLSTDCTGATTIPTPIFSDNCSPTGSSYTVSASAGTLNDNGTAISGLPYGISTITITFVDGCGNESVDDYQITVEDQVNPIPVCETFHTVSLTIDDPALVDALVFDDGSTDNCGIIEYQVRRMSNACYPSGEFTSFGDKVGFFCCDIGTNVMVELRVRDAGEDKIEGNNDDNFNSCMVEVEVQDKLPPVLTCPADKPLDCYEDPFDEALTGGYATVFDNCGATIDDNYSGDLDNCGEGVIFRTFTAVDASGNQAVPCVQTITVENSTPFYICDDRPWNTPFIGCNEGTSHSPNDGVEWPADITLNTCLNGGGLSPEDLEALGVIFQNVRPQIFEDGCDLVGVTYEDVELPIQPDACVKVIRNWKVYDWCRFDANNFDPNDPEGTDGYWEYVQIIKVLTTQDPVIESDCEDISFCSYDEDCENGYATLILDASDDCTPAGDLNYYYWIDLGNNGTDDIHAFGNNASGTYPLGTHSIRWNVEDGCGNVSICEYLFVISDCKKPTPYGHNLMAIELMPNSGMVELWADDLDAGSFDNCGIQDILILEGDIDPIAAAGINPPAGAADGITFDCGDVQGAKLVSLIAVDINGLWDYVTLVVDVQDNMGACGNNANASIAGTIENEEANTVEGVNVAIDGEMVEGLSNFAVTGSTGNYEFPSLINGANYTIEADNDVDPLNGVTTFDLVLMSKHILGIQSLNTPYKLIAADVNKSGSITTFDMVQLRKLILFIDTEFQSNTSWRFVDADFVFPNATNPFQTAFPEVLNFNNLAGEQAGDFVAVKIGDVNCSAQVNGFTGSSDDRSANGEVVFGVKDQALVAGQTYTVDFTAADFAEVLGYQFTLAFDKDAVEFVDVATNLEGLTADNFGTSLINEGVITTSWNSIEAVSLEADAKVFSLTFVAKSNAQLSDVIAVNSRYTKAEGYDNNVNLMNIGLSFNGAAAVAGEFELYQNQPNPFKSETVIGFNLPEAGAATLTVFDVTGKVLKLYQNEFAQGYNEVQINRAELSGSGVLYYQLDTENFSATKKMILIK